MMQLVNYGLDEGATARYQESGFWSAGFIKGALFGSDTTEGAFGGNSNSEARALELVETQGWSILTPEEIGYDTAVVEP